MRPGLCLLAVVALFVADGGSTISATAARGLPPVVVVASASDQVTMNVLELVCRSCAQHVLSGCREIPGVASVEMDLRTKQLTLHFDAALTTRERVIAAVDAVVSTIP